MKCCVCDRGIIENKLSAVPVEPKGMKSATGEERKWICTDCIHHLPRVIQEVLRKLSNCTMKSDNVIEEVTQKETVVFVAEEIEEEK